MKLFSDFNTPSKVKQFENEIFKNKFCNYLKWPILPKMKDIQFRIINNVYLLKFYAKDSVLR